MGLAGEPRGHRIDLHHRGNPPGGEVGHCISDVIERIDLHLTDLSAPLHRNRHVVIGGRGLNPDSGVLQIGEAANLRGFGAVDHKTESGGHVRVGPSQRRLPSRCDSYAPDDAVIAPILHLLQDDLPLGVHEQRLQLQSVGDLLDQIDLEADPLAPEDVFEGRIYEIGADSQDSGYPSQRCWRRAGIGRAAHREKQQRSDCGRSPSHRPSARQAVTFLISTDEPGFDKSRHRQKVG